MTTKQTESVPAGETGTLKGVGEKLSSSLSIAQSYTELRLCLLPGCVSIIGQDSLV
jgi:hypothetical protein